MRALYNNALITVVVLALAALIGTLLAKSREMTALKVERAMVSTANAALARGYDCGINGRGLDECRADLWKNGTAPLMIFGAR